MIFFEKGSFINFKNVASKVIQHLNPPDLCLKGTQPNERKQKNIAWAPYWLSICRLDRHPYAQLKNSLVTCAKY